MKRLFGAGLLAGLMGAALGCGSKGDEGIPVAGNIAVDGTPVGNAAVVYIPQGSTAGNGGVGMTDPTGRYTLTTPQGKNGLPPGQYKVTVSLRLNPDGSAPDPNVPPIESKARETLPAIYADAQKTQLAATIAAGDKKSFDFDLKVKKK